MRGVLSVTSTKDDLHITIQSKPEQIHLFFPFSLLSALSERLIELLIIEYQNCIIYIKAIQVEYWK